VPITRDVAMSPRRSAAPTRPPSRAQRGSGVQPWRLRTPALRASANPTARNEKVAMMTPKLAIDGARNWASRTP